MCHLETDCGSVDFETKRAGTLGLEGFVLMETLRRIEGTCAVAKPWYCVDQSGHRDQHQQGLPHIGQANHFANFFFSKFSSICTPSSPEAFNPIHPSTCSQVMSFA